MADTIKIGNLEIDNLKVGTLSVDALYIGDVKIYPSMPPGPTPTYEWKQYNAGETVPSKLFYGVRLGDPSMDTASIEFGDAFNTDIAFIYDVSYEYGWYAQDMSGEQIDISEYYDETERCFIIYFSDLGLGAMPLYYPAPNDSFEFDVQLYEEHTSTLQWVTYNNGDTIPSDLDIYGISGVSQNLYDTFGYGTHFQFTPSRNKFDWYIANDSGDICYFGGSVLSTEVISAICSEVSCDDYYNQGATVSGTIQLYIYA